MALVSWQYRHVRHVDVVPDRLSRNIRAVVQMRQDIAHQVVAGEQAEIQRSVVIVFITQAGFDDMLRFLIFAAVYPPLHGDDGRAVHRGKSPDF